MSTQLENVLNEALRLPPDERALLVDSLIISLEESDSDVDAAWAVEVQRRSQEYEEGKAATISWSELRDSVRQEFAVKND